MSILANLRLASGKTIEQIIAEAKKIDPEFPESKPGYLSIEERGTRDYWKIHALASVFKVEPYQLAASLKPVTKC